MNDVSQNLRDRLLSLRDPSFADFSGATLPSVSASTIIGIRTPVLRALAKECYATCEPFLCDLPHLYFEENQLHAFLLCLDPDFARCLARVRQFLPFVNNWGTCDQMSPAVFRREAEGLLPSIEEWLCSSHTYTLRFGIKMLMDHFLDRRFSPDYPARVAQVESSEYYVRIMQAWYWATALAKQPDASLPYFEQGRLHPWVHNKAIQKARESFRVEAPLKVHLQTLRIKNTKQ